MTDTLQRHPAEEAFLQACAMMEAVEVGAAQVEEAIMEAAQEGNMELFRSELVRYKTLDVQTLACRAHWSRSLLQLLKANCLSPDEQERCTASLAEQSEAFQQEVDMTIRNQDLVREITLTAASAADAATSYLRSRQGQGQV